MRLLLDTHAWVWWNTGSSRLPRRSADLIRDRRNEVLVSAASVWEVVTKHRLGKLPDAGMFVQDIERVLDADGFVRLSISTVHAACAAALDHAHKDPFDRLLIAQALTEGAAMVTNEALFEAFGVERLWA